MFQCCVGFCHITMQMSHNYIYIFSLLSPATIPLVQVITRCQVKFSVLYSNFPLVIYFMHDRVYMSMLLSQFVLLSPFPIVSTCPLSTSVSPFLPCK